jgi:ankyrin repeat protein
MGATWKPHETYAAGTIAAAARANDLAGSRELIRAGADSNLSEPDGTTPLLWAVYNSSPELVQLLLDAGADPNIANSLGISPLLQASRYGNAGMVSALVASGAKVADAQSATESPLMAAARAGNVDAVQTLLDAGADPNGTEPLDQQTALMWAVAEGHQDIARVLLTAGANPNLQARISELTERKNADFPSGGFAAVHWGYRERPFRSRGATARTWCRSG